MMRDDSKGQVSLEYILILAISLILLVVFTIPLTQQSVESTLDVADTLAYQSDLSKIVQAAEQVYGEGQGSKHSVNIIAPQDVKVNIAEDSISSNLKLKSGSDKQIKVNCKSTLEKSSINLKKGENNLVVEWPEDSENMRIYTKLF